MKKEEFIAKGVETMQNIIMAHLERNLNKVIDQKIVDLEEQPDDYTAVYPTLAAIMLQGVDNIFYGSAMESTQKRMKKETKRIKSNVRFD